MANFAQNKPIGLYRKIRIGAVSYVNTLPLVYGLRGAEEALGITLKFDYPARVAKDLIEDKVDVGLVPVAVIPLVKNAQIVSDYCIGASKPVASVAIFSEVPLEKVTHLVLDYQSKTSVNLARVLLKEYWKLSPQLLPGNENFLNDIKGTTAAVVIGDRALIQQKRSSFVYDLAEAWINHTGLPFVFAAWVANKELPDHWKAQFNKGTGEGLLHLPEIASQHPFEHYDLLHYFRENIDYVLDEEKRRAISLFLEKLKL